MREEYVICLREERRTNLSGKSSLFRCFWFRNSSAVGTSESPRRLRAFNISRGHRDDMGTLPTRVRENIIFVFQNTSLRKQARLHPPESQSPGPAASMSLKSEQAFFPGASYESSVLFVLLAQPVESLYLRNPRRVTSGPEGRSETGLCG